MQNDLLKRRRHCQNAYDLVAYLRGSKYFRHIDSRSMINISLMTFNIAHGRGLSLYQGFHTSRGILKNLGRIAKIIEQYQPDIVALQEVDESSHWNKHIDLLQILQQKTEYPHRAHGVHNTREGRKPLAYGNAFLSKYPIVQSSVNRFGNKKLGEKGFMEVQIDVNGIIIDIINLHLDFRSRKTRIQQAERIVENLEKRKEENQLNLPPIICGDFNTSSRTTHDALRQMTINAAIHGDYDYYPKKELTFPSHFPARGLDFVLTASPFQTHSVKAIKSYASDHLPVMANLKIEESEYQAYINKEKQQ